MSLQAEQAPSLYPGAAGTASQVQAVVAPQSTRLLFLDNLRIVLICGVLVQHLAVTYGATGYWYYRDPVTDPFTATLLTIWNGVGQAAGMGFFFLISGS